MVNAEGFAEKEPEPHPLIGQVFEGRYRRIDADRITPIVTGKAWITAESEIIIDPDDPFRFGIATENIFEKN